MGTPQRSAYVRIEQRSTGSPNRGGYNELLEDWTLLRAVWVTIEQPTRGIDQVVSDTVRRFEAMQKARGDYYDLDGVAAGMRLVFDPQGTFDDAARNVYFRIETVMEDFTFRTETVMQIRRVGLDGSEI